jgi:hypothetical protein
VTRTDAIRLAILLVGSVSAWWQLRWLLRAYRRERDRQPLDRRSSRALLLSTALLIFVVLATIAGLYTARRIAVGAITVAVAIEAIKRRFWGGVS